MYVGIVCLIGSFLVQLSRQNAVKCLNKMSLAFKKQPGVLMSPSIISKGSSK